MARVRWNTATLPKYVHSMYSNTEDWQAIRKAPELVNMFALMGEHIVQELNWELHAAQAARKQKVEDGYKFAINHDPDRIRMRIWAFTARAAAHEAKHQSILKHMRFVGDTKRGTGGRTNPGPNFGSRGARRGGKGGGSRRTGGGSRSGAGTRPPPKSSSRRSGPSMDPRREARLRRQLDVLDRLAAEGSGGTGPERSLAAEKARRLREELGD